MKRWVLFQFFFLISICVFAQSPTELEAFNQQRFNKQKVAMTVLGSWAVGNMAVSGIQLSNSEGSSKYFHQMNIGWNVVNLTLAGFGLHSALTGDPSSLDLYSSIDAQHSLQKVLLFNAGLDVGYMAGGAYLMERSRREEGTQADRLEGFGKSILLQGAFLFAFDLTTYFILASDNKDIANLVSAIQFHGNGFSLALTF